MLSILLLLCWNVAATHAFIHEVPDSYADAFTNYGTGNSYCSSGSNNSMPRVDSITQGANWKNLYGQDTKQHWPVTTLNDCKSLCHKAGCNILMYDGDKRCDLMMSCTSTGTASGWTSLTFNATKSEEIKQNLDATSADWQNSTCPNWAVCDNCTDGRRCHLSHAACNNAVCQKTCCDDCIGDIKGTKLSDIAWCTGSGVGVSYQSTLCLGRSAIAAVTPDDLSQQGKTIMFPTTFNQCHINRKEPNGDKLQICTKGIAEHPDGASPDVAVVGFKVAACWLAAGASNFVCHNYRKVRCVKCQERIWAAKDTWAGMGVCEYSSSASGCSSTSAGVKLWPDYMQRLFKNCGAFQECSEEDVRFTKLHIVTT